MATLELLLALVLEFDSHRDGIELYLQKCKKKGINCLLTAPSSVDRYNSTRVDEGRKSCVKSSRDKSRGTYGSGEEGGGLAM